MYNIADEYIKGFNGLGDADADGSDGQKWSASDTTHVIDTVVNAAANMYTAHENSSNQGSTTNTQGGNYNAGGNPSTYSPSSRTLYDNYNYNNQNNSKKETDYTPWIIGGVCAVALLAVVMMSNNNKR